MNNNKTFFLLTTTEGTPIANQGIKYTNVNLKNILGHIYDKYYAFNIKLESYRVNALNGSVFGSTLLHMSGLHWINGYDSISPLYPTSRVIETLQSTYDLDPEFYIGINFISNCNCVSFYRPSSFIIPELYLFFTNADGTFYLNHPPGWTAFSFCFSITGIDAYRVVKPSKGIVQRMYNRPTASFYLNSFDAESVDPYDAIEIKKRIFVFRNINWSVIIGTEMYEKYNKFCLITTSVFADTNGATLPTGSTGSTLYLSGTNLNFERFTFLPTMPTNKTYNSLNNAIVIHPKYPVFIGHITITGLGRKIFTQTHIENVFIKPSCPVGDIYINVGQTDQLNLNTSTTGEEPFPVFMIGFNIIPVIDD